jgi:hypothetical protein
VGVPQILSYKFGLVNIDGIEYRRDVIVLPDRVLPDWWRKEGHSLRMQDLQAVLADKPDILIVGLGHDSRMRIPEGVKDVLREASIELHALPTAEACERYNQIAGSKRTIAALHLSC